MANLGSQKISSNYKKLLQKDENGMVADGSGSLITLNISGSEYYVSSSDGGPPDVDVLKAITVTGSIVPEGDGNWDLSEMAFKERAEAIYTDYQTNQKTRYSWIRSNLFDQKLVQLLIMIHGL